MRHTSPGGGRSASGRIATIALVATSGVAVIYVPQPIQTLVAADFGVSIADSAAANVAVQAGYALGVLLFVSLGDRFSPRSQVGIQLAATAVALTGAAAAPSHGAYVVMCFIAGATATVGQILITTALRIAPVETRARIVGVLVGSFLVGLFLVRTTLGALADLVGWRGVIMGMVVLLLVLVAVSRRVVPDDPRESPPRVLRILLSIPRIAQKSSTLRLLTLVHALCFAAFIGVWSLSTVHAVTDLGFSVGAAALIGIAGIIGGAATILVAPAHHRVGSRRSFGVSLAALLVGSIILAVAPGTVGTVVAGLLLVSFGLSNGQVSTQSRALASVPPEENGRANTVFVACTFLAGAIATAIAELVYRMGGFGAVSAVSLGYVLVAILLTTVAVRKNHL